MNKKSAYNLYAIIMLLVALIATMLIGCMKVQQESTPTTTIGVQSESISESESLVGNETTQAPTGNAQTEQTTVTGTEPSFKIEAEFSAGTGTPDIETEPESEQPNAGQSTGTTTPTQGQNSQTTQPTQGQSTQPTQPTQGQSTQPTQPTQGQSDSTTQPTQSQSTQTTQPTQQAVSGGNGKPDKLLTYEEFLKLSNEKQQEYFFLFADPLDYAAWLQQAQKDYQDNQDSIVITGPIDLSTLPTGD